jgi:copper chaperone CopZ
MTCGGCVRHVSQALNAVEGVAPRSPRGTLSPAEVAMRVPAAVVVLGLVACSSDDGRTGPRATAAAATGTADTGTRVGEIPDWTDVAAILHGLCVDCHEPGGVAPMPLTTYENTSPFAEAMKVSTADRRMPPWLATDDGTCGAFVPDSPSLGDEQIATLAAWADAGAPPGAATDIALTPSESSPFAYLGRDLALVTPEIVPEAEGIASGPDDEYRCVSFPNDTGVDWAMRGYEVVPGNRAIVHNVLVMLVDPVALGAAGRTNAEEIADLEAADPRPGWDCFGTAGGEVQERAVPGMWSPGDGEVRFPDLTSVLVRSTDWIVVQVHYSLADPSTAGQSDSTTVYLDQDGTVGTEAYVAHADRFLETLAADMPDVLPAGDPAAVYRWSVTGQELLARAYLDDPSVGSFELRSVTPHMNDRGRTQSLHVRRAATGDRECALEVLRWDFDLHRSYDYQTAIGISLDDVVEVECTYDTTDAVQPVAPGWGASDEMCMLGMVLTL